MNVIVGGIGGAAKATEMVALEEMPNGFVALKMQVSDPAEVDVNVMPLGVP